MRNAASQAQQSDIANLFPALSFSRKAFEHWKSKCTLTKLLKELDIYSDVDLVIFEGKNNAISHYHGAGILTFRNGAIFNGFFSDGLKDGFGRYRYVFELLVLISRLPIVTSAYFTLSAFHKVATLKATSLMMS